MHTRHGDVRIPLTRVFALACSSLECVLLVCSRRQSHTRVKMAVPSSPFIARSVTPIGFGSIVPDADNDPLDQLMALSPAPQPGPQQPSQGRWSSLSGSYTHAMVPRTPRGGRHQGTTSVPSTPRDPRMTPGLTDGLVPGTPIQPTPSVDPNESPAMLVPRTPAQSDRRSSNSGAGQAQARQHQHDDGLAQPIRLAAMGSGPRRRRRSQHGGTGGHRHHGQRAGAGQSVMTVQSPMRPAEAPEADSRPGGLILDL